MTEDKTTADLIDAAAREAGVDPNNPTFRAKMFKALRDAGMVSPKPAR